MVFSKRQAACLVAVFFAILLNFREVSSFVACDFGLAGTWGGHGFCTGGEYLDAPREMLRSNIRDEGDLYFVTGNRDGSLSSVERSLQLSFAWEAMPKPVVYGSSEGVRDADVVISGPRGTAAMKKLSAEVRGSNRYDCVAEQGGCGLWMRRKDGASLARMDFAENHLPLEWWREGVGVIVVLAVLTVLFVMVDSASLSEMHPVACGLVVSYAVFVALLTLSHTFLPPNGLGVYGGRAKLLWLCRGLPAGFWNAPPWATLQPTYPPGLVLLTLASYSVSGGCGEWLVQIIGMWGIVALFACLLARCRSLIAGLWVSSLFLLPVVLRMGTQFYAEPFAILCCLLGWERVRGGADSLSGWAMIGLSGFFRPEAVVVLPLAWTTTRIVCGQMAASFAGLVAGLVPSAGWAICCMACGAAAPGLRSLSAPALGQACAALVAVLDSMFVHAWRTGFAWWFAVAAVAAVVSRRLRRSDFRDGRRSVVAALLCIGLVLLLCASFAWRDEPEFDWLLRTSVPRLIWLPTMLAAREVLDLMQKERMVDNHVR